MLERDLGLGAVERSVEEVEGKLLPKFQPDLGCLVFAGTVTAAASGPHAPP